MLDRCDRVQIAVHDAVRAAQRFGQILGESKFELCEADGAGLTQDFLAARGEDDGGWIYPRELHGREELVPPP